MLSFQSLKANSEYLLTVKLIIIVLLPLFLYIILNKTAKFLKKKLFHKKNFWIEKSKTLFFKPLFFLVLIFYLEFVFQEIFERFSIQKEIIAFFKYLALAILLFATNRVWKRELIKNKAQFQVQGFVIDFFVKAITIAVIFLFCLLVMRAFDLSINPILAFGGIGAAAIGFSAKDLIGNFFGGLMLFVNRPFIIGDIVGIDSMNILGQVEEIGWFTTSIVDNDRKRVYVPNSFFSTSAIRNESRVSHRKIEEKINIAIVSANKLILLSREIRAFLQDKENIDPEMPILVVANALNANSYEILIRCYSMVLDINLFMKEREKIILKIKNILDQYQIKLVLPSYFVKMGS